MTCRIHVVVSAILLSACSPESDLPLARAGHRNDAGELNRLLASGADPNGRDLRGLTPLIAAARSGAAESIRILVNAGAAPDLRGGVNGWTPLMHAVHTHQPRSVAALLDAGAPVDARMRDG